MKLNEDFFDDVDVVTNHSEPDENEDTNIYSYTVVLGLGITNYCVTNEPQLEKALDMTEQRIKSFLNYSRFVTNYSKFRYRQKQVQPDETMDIRTEKYAGRNIMMNSKAVSNKNWLVNMWLSFDINFKMKSAKDCYKFLNFIISSKLYKYVHLSEQFYITTPDDEYEKMNADIIFVGDNNSEYDFAEWWQVADIVYDFCSYIFGDDYTYGKMMRELNQDNLDRISHERYFENMYDDEEREYRIVKIGDYDSIHACELTGHFANKNNVPYCGSLCFYNIDGTLKTRKTNPWDPSAKYLYPELEEYLLHTPCSLYIICTDENGAFIDKVVCILKNTMILSQRELVLVFETDYDQDPVAALASVVDETKANDVKKFIHEPKYYYDEDEEY